MIKFFRKIRQELLTKNKFSRYLIYALGEIVLVVIGILIALQINTWNENRKDLIRTQQVLNNLSAEIRQDSIYFNDVYNFEKNLFLYGAEVLFRLHSNDPDLEATDSLIGTSFRLACFTPAIKSLNSAFNELMASNLLSHIRSEELKYHLKEYYGQIDFLKSYSDQSHQLSNNLIYELSQYYEVIPVKFDNARQISNFAGAAESQFTASYDLPSFRNNKSLNPKLYDMIDIHKDRLGGLEILRALSVKIQEGIIMELKEN